ncbi:hypothetical protein AJ79_10077 [Helicocarpus griseus UAMH5409]|uniref:Uncharacterized protein n=1 Tax=Helicocarpus griseus UAMH5409 TaxID=1447875 RepID=A0A2B7W7B5_9EURO|nr:hypothetical protein AJ79_10077 [Helicocarpus griseus UAMH5409]
MEYSSIMWAALYGQEGTARKALDNDGIDTAKYGSALLLAVENGHSAVARLLLDRKAFSTSAKKPLKAAILHGDVEIVKMLLENGFDPNRRHPAFRGRESALHLAVRWGREEVLRLLLAIKDINKRCDDGQDYGYAPTLDELMESLSPIMEACSRGTERMLKIILEKTGFGPSCRAKWGAKLLIQAAGDANVEVVKFLLGLEGLDPNGKDENGWTPLFSAAANGWGEDPETQCCRRAEIIKLLLSQKGVDPNSSYSVTALGVAVLSGRRSIVKAFLESKRVNADSKNSHGRTALSFAAQSGREDIVKWLLARKDVNPDSKDNDGRTPLAYALMNDNSQTQRPYGQSREKKAVIELLKEYSSPLGNGAVKQETDPQLPESAG